jgi:hypothetical protein
MKIRLEEYVGASRVRLSVDDAPMTALSRLVETFVTALDEVSEKQEADSARVWVGVDLAQSGGDMTATVTVQDGRVIDIETVEPPHQAQAEPSKKRGRPRKVETAPEPVATEAQEEPSLPFTSPEPAPLSAGTQETDIPEPTASQTDHGSLPEPDVSSKTATELSTDTTSSERSSELSTEPLPEVTDSEMNRYCGKLAQHWGGAEKVYALAQKFVAEGELPRPTRIAGTEARWAFIHEAETATGVKYHG